MKGPLQIIDCAQNTSEWMQARCGVVTASGFKNVLAKGEGKTRMKYLREKAYEQITGRIDDGFGNFHTERGHVFEPEARDLYEFMTDNKAELVGFMRRGRIGCSPDFLVGTDGMGQVKTALGEILLDMLDSGKVPTGHTAQLQGELMVSGRAWTDFICYCPGLPLFVKRVHRDEAYIARLRVELEEFLAELAAFKASIEARYIKRAA